MNTLATRTLSALLFLLTAAVPTYAQPQVKLTPSDVAAEDFFGYSVALDGDRAVVGAYGRDNGFGDDERGIAYAFRWNGSTWEMLPRLKPSDHITDEEDRFGWSVAIDGDHALVGAPMDEENGFRSGSVQVFRWEQGQWMSQQKLTASESGQQEQFGYSVAIDGDYALIGTLAYGAYVFHWDGTTWVEQQKLTASDGTNSGSSVAIAGDYAVIGAYRDDPNGNSSGSAYVFHWDGSTWVEQQKIISSDNEAVDYFGWSVALDGDNLLIGARRADDNEGAAYVFRRDGTTWVEQQKLTASDIGIPREFGYSVALNGDRALIGAPWEASGQGSAYEFRREGTMWVEQQKMTASSGQGFFGGSVSVSGDYAFIGAPWDDENGINSGSAYAFSLVPHLELSTNSIALSEIPVGETATTTFTVTNTGFAPLSVADAASTNEAFTISPASFTLAPGQIEEVTVAFTPPEPGSYEGELVLTHNGETSPDAIALSGTARGAEISIASTALSFPATPVEGTATQTLVVGNVGLVSLEVTVASTDGAFSAAVSTFSVPVGEEVELDVAFTPPEPGSYEGELVLTHNGETSPDAVAVSGTARGAEIGLSPNALTFPSTAAGESSSRTLSVTNPGLLPLEVSSVESTDGAFSASPSSFSVTPGGSETVTVTFTPPAAGSFEGDLVFTHNAETSPDVVALSGDSDPTQLAFSPSSLSFGTLDTGASTTRNLQVARSGPASEVTVTAVYTSDDAFAVEVETPFTVVAPVNVPVTFSPPAGQSYEGYVYFVHDGASGPDSVAVSGAGRYNARLSEIATYTVGTNFVNVFLRATDASGRGLNIPAEVVDQNIDLFRVFDDGNEVSPTAPETFYQVLKFDEVPYRLRTVLLLDNSTSVGNDLDEIRDAARTIVDNLAENQEVALYIFDSEVTLLQDFTSDADLLRAAIDGIDVGSPSTALYNGLVTGLSRWEDEFVLTDNGDGNVEVDIERGFLVLLSDGEDTAGGASLAEVLAARGDKRVYAVGYGDVNGSVLNQVGNAGVYTVGTAGELPAVFAEVQAEIENDARSFYILNYSSPRRSNQTWPLDICLRGNTYTGPDACAETTYNSTGFTDPIRGVFINRSLEAIYGVDEVEVDEGGTVLTATTILGLNEPQYEWTSSDESQVTVEAIEGTNQVIATRVGPVGGTATITVADVANNLTRSVNATLVVPNEEGATAAGFALGGVYPNPTREQALVAYEVGSATKVRITLYDVLGRRVLTAHNGLVPAGAHVSPVATSSLAAGVYVLRVEAGDTVETKRITVIR